MTESTPPAPEQLRQLNRDLMEKVIDKATSDPGWKQRLLDGPEAAMQEAGFPEAHQIEQMLALLSQEGAEVRGQEWREDWGDNWKCVNSIFFPL